MGCRGEARLAYEAVPARVIALLRSEIPTELVLFNDTRIAGVRAYAGHSNHFHLRMR